jgi:hypothetical protein
MSPLQAIYIHPLGRALMHRLGPAVWRLPAVLRRRLCHESGVPRLPGVRVWHFGQAERVRPAVPWGRGVAPTFGHRLAARPYRCARPFVAELPQAWLVGQHACVVSPQGRVLLTAFRDQARILGLEPNADLVDWLNLGGWRRPFEPRLADVFPMVNRLDPNYYHWLVEYCGQLEGLAHYERETGRRPKILIRKGGPAFHRASLELLGIAPDRIIEWDPAQGPIAAERVIVASLPGNRVACSPSNLRWLRDRFLQSVEANLPDRPGRRLYIRRKTGAWRSIVNDDQVASLLEAHGFETVRAEGLSFAEQVRLFADAELIVGMHGAGLANLLFAPRAAVIELTGAYGGGEYFSMAAALGNPYAALPCAPGGADGHDVVVDAPALESLLRAIMVQPRMPVRGSAQPAQLPRPLPEAQPA